MDGPDQAGSSEAGSSEAGSEAASNQAFRSQAASSRASSSDAGGNERSSDELRIVVAALTYKRPDDLAQIIPTLLEQADSVDDPCRVLIVDNDPDAGAEALVSKLAAGRALDYVHAATPGIASARNIALGAAAEFDILVFIDDDERPSSGWLAALVSTYREFRSAAVVGPVVSEYSVQPDQWIVDGRFFDRRRLATGTRVDLAATNNLLLDMNQVRSFGLEFDERFGLSGGSDTLFTRQLHAAGGVMIWCDEALVYDIVPEHRLTRRWVLQRAFRSGNTWMRTSLEMAPTPAARTLIRTELAARGAARVLGGTGRMVFGAVTGRRSQRVRGIRTIARGMASPPSIATSKQRR